MKSLADLLRSLEVEQEALRKDAPQAGLVLSKRDIVDASAVHAPLNVVVSSTALVTDSGSLHKQVTDAVFKLGQMQSSHSHPLQEMEHVRTKLLDLRTRLTVMWEKCGVDTSSVVALTEAAECDDLSDLFDEIPTVWAQSTDAKRTLDERTAQLRLLQKLTTVRKHMSVHLAATRALDVLTKREKRLSNDLDESRVVLEFIGRVKDRVAHVERMALRSGIDEDALLDLQRTTILEEERSRFHIAGNDIKGLKAITKGYKMQSVAKAAILPEIGALEALLRKKSLIERKIFADIGMCGAAWREVEDDCEAILALVSETRGTHHCRRVVADVAYETVMQSLATRTIAAIR
jgi:hypothetical protein